MNFIKFVNTDAGYASFHRRVVARFRDLRRRLHRRVDYVVLYDHFKLNFRKQIHTVLTTSLAFLMALLSVAPHF